MVWPDLRENPAWPGSPPTKRPAEALVSESDPQRGYEGSAKRLCTSQGFSLQESTVLEASHSFFQPGVSTGFAADPWTLDVGVAQPMTGLLESAGSVDFGAWSTSSTALHGLGDNTTLDMDTAVLNSHQTGLASMQWTQDFDGQMGGNWFSGVDSDQHLAYGQDLPFLDGFMSTANYGPFGVHNHSEVQTPFALSETCQTEDQATCGDAAIRWTFDEGIDFGFGMNGVVTVDPSSASEVDGSPGVDVDGDGGGTTAGTTPMPLLKNSGSDEEDSTPDPVFDTCFGLLLIENFQLRDKFVEDKTKREVLLEIYSQLLIIRDLQSKEYCGLVREGCAEPLLKLVADRTIKLSACLKSPTLLEVLVYGCRANSSATGEMLFEHSCFLQQPDSFDDSTTYFNPQCLAREEDDGVTMWEHIDLKEGEAIRAANLSAGTRSQVTELLDSASGPAVFRRAQVSEMLKTPLREHQLKALAMMVEKESGVLREPEFPSVWVDETETNPARLRYFNTITGTRICRKPKPCLGGLLADDMGLGKTLSTLALIAGSVARNGNRRRATLIVAPLSTLTAWQDQIERHFKESSLRFTVYHGSQREKDAELLSSFDVVLTTYGTIQTEHAQPDSPGKGQGVIQRCSWHRVVLDEAHVIENRSSKRFQAVHALQARHRWCLTGTPIQNRLEDLSALVEFLRVNPFDNPREFRRVFLEPIDRQDSKGWDRLRSLVQAISLRRTKAALEQEIALPPPQTVTCQVSLDVEERRAYNLVKRRCAMAIDSGGGQINTFQLILRLRQICNHGVDLLPTNLREWLQLTSRFGIHVPLQPEICESCGLAIQEVDEAAFEVLSCVHQICRTCRLEARKELDLDGALGLACPMCQMTMRRERCEQDSLLPRSVSYRPSSKVRALLQNLDEDKRMAIAAGLPPEKSVVFSAWTGMLDLIEKALSAKNITFQRVDGAKTFGQRRAALQDFRNNGSCNVLLASLGSAAVGLDLTMASHVHLVEPGWNPALERQALDRVHRLGQTRPVKQVRYVVEGADSVERYILQRQEWKMALIEASLSHSSDLDREMTGSLLKDMRLALGIETEL